jgi:hypothetical protein
MMLGMMVVMGERKGRRVHQIQKGGALIKRLEVKRGRGFRSKERL